MLDDRVEVDRLYFSVVRLIPDSLRGELVNVGLLAVFRDRLYVRTLPSASRVQRAVLPESLLGDIPYLREMIDARFDNAFPDEHADGTVIERDLPTAGFLRYLAHRGVGPFLVDEPKWRMLPSPHHEPTIIVEHLFRRLVEPYSAAPFPRREPMTSRAQTVVRRVLDSAEIPVDLVPRRVRIMPAYAEEPRDFGFALANGKITLGQTIEFAVNSDRQDLHTFRAIANAFEMRQILKEDNPCINIVRTAAEHEASSDNLRRLEQIGDTLLLPRDTERFIRYIKANAERNVADAMRERGFEVKVESGGLDVGVSSAPEDALSRELDRRRPA